jgi:hypothetical protein
MNRREFVGTVTAGMVGSALLAGAQETAPAQASGGAKEKQPVKTWSPKVERLFKIEGLPHPNAMEATPDGLWVGDQVSEKAFKVDWKTGKVLTEVQTESHNTSGIAVGDGYLWMAANGGTERRPKRPTDNPYGEISQIDMKTGKIVKLYPLPWGGGVHGSTFDPQRHSLWINALALQAVAELDIRDNMRIKRMFSAKGTRAHGLGLDNDSVWVMFAADREAHKFDPNGGKLLEVVKLSKTGDPDPHGMCIHDGYMYYCDAGLTAPGPGTDPGVICRFKLNPAT